MANFDETFSSFDLPSDAPEETRNAFNAYRENLRNSYNEEISNATARIANVDAEKADLLARETALKAANWDLSRQLPANQPTLKTPDNADADVLDDDDENAEPFAGFFKAVPHK